MQNKLFDITKKYAQSGAIRFHMPAHNGEDIGICTAMDITELSFSDNLIESDGVIANCEKNIAQAYGVNFALMLTCGATSGVAIALHAAANKGKNLLLIGDCHKSVHNYAMIFGFSVTKADNFENICANDFDAIVITSPDYFGQTKDVTTLKNTTALVIVDASHGSHFAFCDALPDLQTNIADITILSFHKTLPVLTGGAGLLCNSHDIYDMLCYSRSLIHSSSPNYLTMASIDKAICDFSKHGQTLYSNCLKELQKFENSLCKTKYEVVKTCDKTRLCISTKGKSADRVAKLLEEQNIFLEMTYKDLLVAIVTPFNCVHLQKLSNALNEIDVAEKAENIRLPKSTKHANNKQKVRLIVPQNALGKVCAANVGVYPPGTPLLTVYDVITEEILRFLNSTKCEIFGLVNGKIPVFEE